MSEIAGTALSARVLREVYDIEIEPDMAARIDGALLASGRKVLDLFAKDPAPIDGFGHRERR